MNILHVVHYPVFGGPHNQALRLAKPLADRGYRTIVVVPDEPGNAAERLRAGGVEVRQVPLHRLRAAPDPRIQVALAANLPREIAALRRLIRREQIDIVQVGGLVNPHAAIAARLEHVPVVWQLLDTRAPRPLAAGAMTLVRALADVVMATGTAVAAAHPGYASIADRTTVFFPPVDLDRFAPARGARSDVRAAWGVPDDAVVVGCVANINPQKGITQLVRAFGRAWQRFPAARLVLVGAEYPTHASYSAAVRAVIADAGMTEGHEVLLLGERDDVETQLAGMDLFALAAAPRSEGITTSVLEAMAAGLPVIVTDVGALREAVHNERDGLVVPADCVDPVAAALSQLIGDPATRAKMGHAARKTAESLFGIDSTADRHVLAYQTALARRGRARQRPGAPPGSSLDPLPPPASLSGSIPIYLDDPDRAVSDELDHGDGHDHKAAQAAHFDQHAAAEFEIERPRGTSRLYRFLLGEKFRRATKPLGPHLVGASALTVCGGSGMDAEFLARAGAHVVSSDLSLGAAMRAKERSDRHRVAYTSIVADVERLPFGDQTIDLVAVHDGLHHLADPYVGLAEMARVARRWVAVTEPARAAGTKVAVRLGFALETEEAGNRVARLDPREVAAFLAARGYRVLRGQRYAMYYPHDPGRVFDFLSRPGIYPMVRVGWSIMNTFGGRFGNKMVVVAERVTRQPQTQSGHHRYDPS